MIWPWQKTDHPLRRALLQRSARSSMMWKWSPRKSQLNYPWRSVTLKMLFFFAKSKIHTGEKFQDFKKLWILASNPIHVSWQKEKLLEERDLFFPAWGEILLRASLALLSIWKSFPPNAHLHSLWNRSSKTHRHHFIAFILIRLLSLALDRGKSKALTVQ